MKKRFLILALMSFWIALLTVLLWQGMILAAEPITGKASWYSTEACKYNPDSKCPTASGESLYDLEKNQVFFAAMNRVRLGSKIKVCNQKNWKCVIVVIKDRGGFEKYGRIIDLSKKAFFEISPLTSGIVDVTVEVLQ